MCWIWVPSVFCGEFQDDFTPLCPVVVRDAPLHLSQTARRCWDPVQGGFSSVSSAGSEHHTPSGIQMEKECSKCSHSVAILPFQWNKSEKLQSSQHILLHVWVPQPVPARGLSGISPGSRSIVLPFSIPNSWDTCSPATHLPFDYRIHLTGEKDGWAHPSSGLWSSCPLQSLQLQLRLCSPALHILCLGSRRGWVKGGIIY